MKRLFCLLALVPGAALAQPAAPDHGMSAWQALFQEQVNGRAQCVSVAMDLQQKNADLLKENAELKAAAALQDPKPTPSTDPSK